MLNTEKSIDTGIQVDFPLQYKQEKLYDAMRIFILWYIWKDLQNLYSSLVLTFSVGDWVREKEKEQNILGLYIA